MKDKNKKLFKSILNVSGEVLKGIVGGVNPIAGMVVGAASGAAKAAANEIEKNKAEDDAVVGAGKINWAKLAPKITISLVSLVGAYLVFTGKIEIETLKSLLKLMEG